MYRRVDPCAFGARPVPCRSDQPAIIGAIDERTMYFALGCVLYEMLAGKPAFGGSTSQAVVAPAIETANWRALAKLPERRPASAMEFVDLLR